MSFKLLRSIDLGAKNFQDASPEVQDQVNAEYVALVQAMRTADGLRIVDGLRVWTNDLERGRVDLDRLDFEYHHGEKRWVPWFYVVLDVNGRSVMQSDDRVAHRWKGEVA